MTAGLSPAIHPAGVDGVGSRDDTSPLTIDPAAPFFIIVNAGSGRSGTIPPREIIEGVLTEAGREHHVAVVEDPSRLPHVVRQSVASARKRGGIVVAVGGDGTINAVVQVMLDSGIPLGVVPHGTFNYFSRTHGIPDDTAEATRLLLSARAHPVQIGLVNDRVFLVNASLGLYPKVIEDREAHEKQFGRSRLVSFWSAAVTLLREHRQLRLRVEDSAEVRDLRTPTLVVANNRLQLEHLGIPEASVVDGGRLAAIHLRPVGSLAMTGLLLRGALGRLGAAENVDSFAFNRIVVTPALPYGTRSVKVATDGETFWLRAPLEFRIAPDRLFLLKPESAPVDPAPIEDASA